MRKLIALGATALTLAGCGTGVTAGGGGTTCTFSYLGTAGEEAWVTTVGAPVSCDDQLTKFMATPGLTLPGKIPSDGVRECTANQANGGRIEMWVRPDASANSVMFADGVCH